MALKGVKVIEIVGLSPIQMCGMILSDFGADVIRVEKPFVEQTLDCLTRGKKSMTIDLKSDDGKEIFRTLCSSADVLIEPFRAGTMEELGIGPENIMKLNKKLIYARLSGFGQYGPLSNCPGYDINFLAVSGILDKLGDDIKPHPPLNILGDFAGGAVVCALGICMALIERESSGEGQVIDANTVEGSNYVTSWVWFAAKSEILKKAFSQNLAQKGKNVLDGGAPFYRSYKTKDNKYMSVGSWEPVFYARMIEILGFDPEEYHQYDTDKWDELKKNLEKIFALKTQKEWSQIFDGIDACVMPVIDLSDASKFGHNKERESFLEDGTPKPAPILSRTPAIPRCEEPVHAQHTLEILKELGFSMEEIKKFQRERVIEIPE